MSPNPPQNQGKSAPSLAITGKASFAGAPHVVGGPRASPPTLTEPKFPYANPCFAPMSPRCSARDAYVSPLSLVGMGLKKVLLPTLPSFHDILTQLLGKLFDLLRGW